MDTTSTITIPRMDPIDAGRITASEAPRAVITTTDVSCYYGSFRAVNEVTMDIGLHEITALIGPSGCCLLYTSPSPRDRTRSRMPSSA